ncbi:MAG: hypothetical protein IE909_05265 [Campylobacterales bacterium]|nr:hypothetical protein [Campylobacterales bacterium]
MYEIKVVNPCSCAKKRKSWMKELCFSTFEEAKETALKMCIQGNEKFCKRHEFDINVKENIIQIVASAKKDR